MTIPFEVRNRFTGEVQFVAQIECEPDTLPSVKRGLAVKWAVMNEADLTGAYLTEADLPGADLTGANLTRAKMSGAKASREE